MLRINEERKDINILAYHEAAHCCVAIRLFCQVEYVTIVPSGDNGDIWGHARIPFDFSEDSGMIQVMDHVMINFAGQVAEDIINGISYDDSQIHSDADRENIATMVFFCMNEQSEIDLFLAWMYERTRLYLINSWSWVEAVASALLECKTLSGDEVRRICLSTDCVTRDVKVPANHN